jgi:hypothetical protein
MMANQQLFANNPALQQQMQYMMPYYLQQVTETLVFCRRDYNMIVLESQLFCIIFMEGLSYMPACMHVN